MCCMHLGDNTQHFWQDIYSGVVQYITPQRILLTFVIVGFSALLALGVSSWNDRLKKK